MGIRFRIGGEETIYLDGKINSDYVQGALDRRCDLPEPSESTRYPTDRWISRKETDESVLTMVRKMSGLPVPQEQEASAGLDEDGDAHRQIRFYWDLRRVLFCPEQLIREIILGDIGGWSGFTSNVYLAGPGPYLYHLYDDRGLDVLGSSQELLLPLYRQFHSWILEYDLEQIDRLFAS
ncbi:MAG: DUF3885 domain-containing protein [Bacteroides cellulosilyticus]